MTAEPTADRPFRPLRVAPEHAGWRLDAYLSARFASWSRAAVQRAIKAGEVESDRRRLKPSSLLEGGELLRLYMKGLAPDGPAPPLPPILYEDERLLVLNKPPRLLCHPAGDKYAYAVIGLARDARPDHRVDLCHRLDRDTSGILVLSKDLAANAAVKHALKHRDEALAKTYQALCWGEPAEDRAELRGPIGEATGSQIRLRRGVHPEGQPAWTSVEVLARRGALSLVACRLHTGRTHQIRVHLEAWGHAIVGDRIYGQPDEVFLEWNERGATPMVRAAARFPRQCLHAWRMRLPHPDGPMLELEAPLPDDMQGVLAGAPVVWPEGVEDAAPDAPEEEDEGA
jgi:RluA family pseudouridine synthase